MTMFENTQRETGKLRKLWQRCTLASRAKAYAGPRCKYKKHATPFLTLYCRHCLKVANATPGGWANFGCGADLLLHIKVNLRAQGCQYAQNMRIGANNTLKKFGNILRWQLLAIQIFRFWLKILPFRASARFRWVDSQRCRANTKRAAPSTTLR